MKPLLFDFPSPTPLGFSLTQLLGADEGQFHLKSFPDEESYLRLNTTVKDRDVIINAPLIHPNDCMMNLIFLSDTLRRQGAKQVGLSAPYLAYMRQDKVFQPGEALTSATFATLLSTYFDYLVTIDPHLHRYLSLNEIYTIPTTVLHAAPLLSGWIQSHVPHPFIIGPDAESAQWVKEISGNFPSLILNKVRYGDGHVEITWPETTDIGDKTPVLLDDIISSGDTILQTIHHLKELGTHPPICLAIHGIFAGNSYQNIKNAGATEIITCNSISHPTNQIDLAPLLVEELRKTHR